MELVQAAYRGFFYNHELVFTGHEDQLSWAVPTEYSSSEIKRLQETYGEDLLVLGFTHEVGSDDLCKRISILHEIHKIGQIANRRPLHHILTTLEECSSKVLRITIAYIDSETKYYIVLRLLLLLLHQVL